MEQGIPQLHFPEILFQQPAGELKVISEIIYNFRLSISVILAVIWIQVYYLTSPKTNDLEKNCTSGFYAAYDQSVFQKPTCIEKSHCVEHLLPSLIDVDENEVTVRKSKKYRKPVNSSIASMELRFSDRNILISYLHSVYSHNKGNYSGTSNLTI